MVEVLLPEVEVVVLGLELRLQSLKGWEGEVLEMMEEELVS